MPFDGYNLVLGNNVLTPELVFFQKRMSSMLESGLIFPEFLINKISKRFFMAILLYLVLVYPIPTIVINAIVSAFRIARTSFFDPVLARHILDLRGILGILFCGRIKNAINLFCG